MSGKIRLREAWAGFFGAAQDAGILIEADEVAPTPSQPDPPPVATESATDQDALRAQIEEQSKANAALQSRIAAMEQDARTARFTALAQGWHGETAAHLRMLELCAKEGGETGEAFTAYAALQNGIAETLRQSRVFTTVGSDRVGGAGTAWAKIESQARKIAADQGITKEQATVQVMDADPALYRQYLAEQE